jgi:hypothetical protein
MENQVGGSIKAKAHTPTTKAEKTPIYLVATYFSDNSNEILYAFRNVNNAMKQIHDFLVTFHPDDHNRPVPLGRTVAHAHQYAEAVNKFLKTRTDTDDYVIFQPGTLS